MGGGDCGREQARHGGFSRAQWLLGKNPNHPGGFFDGDSYGDMGLISSVVGSHGGYFLLFHLWKYVLTQFREFRITLSSKKIEIGK